MSRDRSDREIVAGEVIIRTMTGPVPAYRALPDKNGKFPLVLVVQEIFGVHEHIKDVCRRLAKLLPSLSGERVAGEMLRLLLAPDAAGVVALMLRERVLEPILPELTDVDRLAALVEVESEAAEPDAIRRLASLIAKDGAAAAAVAERILISRVSTTARRRIRPNSLNNGRSAAGLDS